MLTDTVGAKALGPQVRIRAGFCVWYYILIPCGYWRFTWFLTKMRRRPWLVHRRHLVNVSSSHPPGSQPPDLPFVVVNFPGPFVNSTGYIANSHLPTLPTTIKKADRSTSLDGLHTCQSGAAHRHCSRGSRNRLLQSFDAVPSERLSNQGLERPWRSSTITRSFFTWGPEQPHGLPKVVELIMAEQGLLSRFLPSQCSAIPLHNTVVFSWFSSFPSG